MELSKGSRVRATETKNDIAEGDTGTVVAAWVKAIVLIRWDRTGQLMSLNRKRFELLKD